MRAVWAEGLEASVGGVLSTRRGQALAWIFAGTPVRTSRRGCVRTAAARFTALWI